MEIGEGAKGPAFMVISEDDISCMGDTPTIAWEQIQKKKNMRIPKWYRTQFSKVDGAELFGFTNPSVQRLFRELVASENGTAQQSDRSLNQNGENLKSDIGTRYLSEPILGQPGLSMPNVSDANLEWQQKTVKDHGKAIDSTAGPPWGARRKRGSLTGQLGCSADQNVTCDTPAKVDHFLEDKKVYLSFPEECKTNPLSKDKTGGLISSDNMIDSGNQRKGDCVQSPNVLTYSRRRKLFSDGCIAEDAKSSDIMSAHLQNLKECCDTTVRAQANISFSEDQSECIILGESKASILTAIDLSNSTQNFQPPAVMTEGSTRKKRLKLDKRKAILMDHAEPPKGNTEENVPCMAAKNGDARKQTSSSFGAVKETGLLIPDTLELVEDNKYLNSINMPEDENHTCCGMSIDKEYDVQLGNSMPMTSDLSGHIREEESSQHPEHIGISQACIDSQTKNINTLSTVNLGKGTIVASELGAGCIQPYTALGYNQSHSDCTLGSSIGNAKQVLQEIKVDEVLKDDKAAVFPLEPDPVFSAKDPTLSDDSNLTLSEQTRQFAATQSSDGKADSDSMGQELAKSMMTVLLPQALPLLKQTAKKMGKNKSDHNMHVPSLAECDLNIESFDKRGLMRNETEKSCSSGMCLATDLDICPLGFATTDVAPSAGTTVPDGRLGLEVLDLYGQPSDIVFSFSETKLKDFGNRICKKENVDGVFHPTEQCLDDEMIPSKQVINECQIYKQDDTIQQNAKNQQKLCNVTHAKTTAKMDEIHREELPCVPFNGKKKHDASGFLDQTGNSTHTGFLKSAQTVDEHLEFKNYDSPEGRNYKHGSSKQGDENNNVCIVKQDLVVVECIVPDSFEDEQCSDDNVNRKSCHLGPPGAYRMPVNELRDSFVGRTLLAADAEVDSDAFITCPMSLKENELVQKTEGATNNTVTSRKIVNSVTSFPSNHEFVSMRVSKEANESNTLECEKLDCGISQQLREEIHALCEHKYNFSTDKTCKAASFCGQTDHAVSQVACRNDSGMQKMDLGRLTGASFSGICDAKENLTMANFLDQVSVNGGDDDINNFSKLNGMSAGMNEKCKSISTFEPGTVASQFMLENKADSAFPQPTLNISEWHSQDAGSQNADKHSGIQKVHFHAVSDSESASCMTKHMSNFHENGILADKITKKENLLHFDKEVGACIQSMNKEAKSIPAMLSFSDVPPRVCKSNIVADYEDGPLFGGELNVEGLHLGLASQDVDMVGIHRPADGNKNTVESSELVGWYEHPIPVLSLVLCALGKDVHLCVVCGLSYEKERMLFIYKVVTGEASGECSSLVGYTVVDLPDAEDYFDVKLALDRSGIQLTPDGQNLILLESIRIRDMGERAGNCVHSKCISHGQCEGHGVKLVSIKNEIVSILTRLTSMESMYCILVSAPQYLIAAGENGHVHVWKMDLRWSMCVEEFVLPSAACTSSAILELVAVPQASHLIISRNCDGYYAIWDTSRRLLLSTFCGADWSIFQTLVLDIVSQERCNDMSMNFDGVDCKLPSKIDCIKDCKDKMLSTYLGESRMSWNTVLTPYLEFNKENMAVCLLVLAAPHPDQIQGNKNEFGVGDERNPTGSWRLALLKNNVLLMGSILDVRASVATVLSQNGVIGTSEGLIYTWEVMTGRKLFILKDFEGVNVSCISSDPRSHAFAAAGSDHRVLLYLKCSQCR